MGHYPRTDISVDSTGLLIEISVPGLSISDITLELTSNTLVVSGRHEERNQHARYIEKELYTGYFVRKYPINTARFDISKITSKVFNGLLVVRVPHKNITNNIVKVIDIKEEK